MNPVIFAGDKSETMKYKITNGCRIKYSGHLHGDSDNDNIAAARINERNGAAFKSLSSTCKPYWRGAFGEEGVIVNSEY